MKFDASIQARDLNQLPALVRAAEIIGFDALWSHETQHDPFLPLTLISEHSETLFFGTSVAIAFARSGDPNAEGHPSWPAYSVKGDVLMDFTVGGPVAGPDPRKARLDLVEALASSPAPNRP